MRGGSNELLSKFITHKAPVTVTSRKILQLYDTFKLDYALFLPTLKPDFIKYTPFEYHSIYNDNKSLISKPRLSVTKLLTESWCELREFYNIYSGSIQEPKTEALSLGTRYHEELESQTFEAINIAEFEKVLKQIFPYESLDGYSVPEKVHDSVLEDVCFDSESELSCEWAENLIFKLMNLLMTSETREVLVHNFLNLLTLELNLNANAVLISGIIDYIKLSDPSDNKNLAMFEEIQASMDSNCKDGILNLDSFLICARDIIEEHKSSYQIKVTDIKTRRHNLIPNQNSVLTSAYLQVSFYKQFFDNLASDTLKAFGLLSANAKARNCDLDKPIHSIILFSLLRKYPELFLQDFKNIASGNDIGAEYQFYLASEVNRTYDTYDFTGLFTPQILKQLRLVDNFDYDSILTDEILRKWESPLTLRYFACRAAQFFNLFQPFKSDSLSIEYHNVRTKLNFKTIEYIFNQDHLNNSLLSAANFWNGISKPKPVDDVGKCKYCEFSSRCVVPNKDFKAFGRDFNRFLQTEDVKHHQNMSTN